MTDFLNLPLSSLVPSGFNPRKTFPEAALEELAESIRKVGVLQPIVVRPDEEGYAIVCGERRYRAAILAGLDTIPAIVREMDDSQALEAAIVENLQREDVDPMEEADGFRALIASGQYDEQTLAERLGRTIAYVVGRLRLANLCLEGRGHLDSGMPIGLALLIAPFPEADQITLLMKMSWGDRWMSLSNARQVIRDMATMPIAKAPWKLDSIDYGRACEGCPKRTGEHPTLLPEFAGEDLCTSPGCWATKATAYATQLVKAKPGSVGVSWPGNNPKGVKMLNHWEVIKVEPGREYSPKTYDIKPAVFYEGGVPVLGEVAVRKQSSGSGMGAEYDERVNAEAKARKRKVEIEREARKLMAGVVLTLDFQYEAVTQEFETCMAALCRLFWDQLGGSLKAMTWIAGQMGWEIPVVSEKSWEGGGTRNVKKPALCIENLQDADALKLLRLLAVQRVLSADDEWSLDGRWQQNAQPDPCALLEGLGVDVAFCRAKAANIVDEKEAKKAKGKKS